MSTKESAQEHEFTKKVLDDSEEAPTTEVDSDTPTKKKKKKPSKKSADTTKKSKKKQSKKAAKKETKPAQPEAELTEEADDAIVLAPARKKDIDDDLREIYSDKDGLLPDMTTFQTKRPPGLLRALSVLLLSLSFLAVVAWIGFFTFQPQARFSEQDVIVAVNGPEEIAIGDEVRYRIKYTNDQAVPLTQATMQVRYPAGFVFVSSSIPATSDTNDTWQLGSIEERDSDTIEIYGRLYGDVDTEQSLRVFFNYTPANFSSEFQKVESARTAFTESPIELTLVGAETVGVGVPSTWNITVTGVEESPVTVELILPDGFSLSRTEPAADAQSPRSFTIEPGASSTTIMVEGIFTEAIDAELRAIARIALDEATGTSIREVTVAEDRQEIAVSETGVVTNLFINGVLGDFGIQAGDTLNATIVVQNAGELPMENVSVRFAIDAPSDGSKTIFDWVDLIDDADGAIVGEQLDADTRRGSITWTSSQIPALRTLAPGEEVQIVFALPILSAGDADLTAFGTYVAAARTDVQYTQADTRETTSANPIDITINSDLRFSTQHTVTPPLADDQPETHEIIYLLENSFHGLSDIELSVDIFGDSEIVDLVVPAGEVDVHTDTGTLTWTVPQMPLSVDILPLQFTIRLQDPNPSQTNLTSKVRIRATDIVTQETITMVGSEILLDTETVPELSA